MLNLLSKVVIALGVVGAAYLNASQPLWAMPSARVLVLRMEPASSLHHPASPAIAKENAR